MQRLSSKPKQRLLIPRHISDIPSLGEQKANTLSLITELSESHRETPAILYPPTA